MAASSPFDSTVQRGEEPPPRRPATQQTDRPRLQADRHTPGNDRKRRITAPPDPRPAATGRTRPDPQKGVEWQPVEELDNNQQQILNRKGRITATQSQTRNRTNKTKRNQAANGRNR